MWVFAGSLASHTGATLHCVFLKYIDSTQCTHRPFLGICLYVELALQMASSESLVLICTFCLYDMSIDVMSYFRCVSLFSDFVSVDVISYSHYVTMLLMF